MNNRVTPFGTAPLLRNQRQFPNDDVRALANQIDHAYIDIATKVNLRIIGIFNDGVPNLTGERWYISSNPNTIETFRQVYLFGAITAGTQLNIPTNISNMTTFTRIYGVAVTSSGVNFRPLPYVDTTAANSIAVLVGLVAGVQNIQIKVGSGSPNIGSGQIVLEWY